ncbi:MAG TPA: hypothetical protein VFC78_18560 [Tepidisphaeraceae bacterium]|nr:hypothetical protein [Tepidisphaeraceae bacterium]
MIDGAGDWPAIGRITLADTAPPYLWFQPDEPFLEEDVADYPDTKMTP